MTRRSEVVAHFIATIARFVKTMHTHLRDVVAHIAKAVTRFVETVITRLTEASAWFRQAWNKLPDPVKAAIIGAVALTVNTVLKWALGQDASVC